MGVPLSLRAGAAPTAAPTAREPRLGWGPLALRAEPEAAQPGVAEGPGLGCRAPCRGSRGACGAALPG